jgi:hypothetical protein
MMLPTLVAVATTALMLHLVFVLHPTRGNAMPRSFAPSSRYASAFPQELSGMSIAADGAGVQEAVADAPSPASPDHVELEGRSGEEEGGEEEVPRPRPRSRMQSPGVRRAKVGIFGCVLVLLALSDLLHAPLWLISLLSALGVLCMDLLIIVRADRASALSFLRQVGHRMPWSIGPFVICMFLM